MKSPAKNPPLLDSTGNRLQFPLLEETSIGTCPDVVRDRAFEKLAGGHLSDEEITELAEFLDTQTSPEAMDLSWLDGFLCAIASGPVRVDHGEWLPIVWGVEPKFASSEQSARIRSLIFRHADAVAGSIDRGFHAPLLPEHPYEGLDNVAQTWCAGFVQAMDLRVDAWEPFLNDRNMCMMLMPIFVLGDPAHFVDDPTPDPAAVAGLIGLLPTAIQTIAHYWRGELQLRSKLARGTKPPARTPSTKTATVKSSAKTATGRSGAKTATAHRLKIELVDVKPRVWRRIEISSDVKLPELSKAILMSMGWLDSHLHAFEVGRMRYGSPDPDFPGDVRDERRFSLADIAPNPKDRFVYEYDFGDGWRHRVTVEAVFAAGGDDLPICIGGARACPPEDCGGPYGYADLLEALADSTHEDHEAMVEWAPEDFDPDEFDLEEANAILRGLGRRGRRSSRARRSPLAQRAVTVSGA